MTRERTRAERRDVDLERGEPLAGGAARGGPRGLRRAAKPLRDWSTRPRILITNDDGVESRGLLTLRQALEPLGETTVVAPDTNQSAVGHQKTLMRPLRVRERTLIDGSVAYSVDGSPTDAVSLAFLGYFGHGFDLVASGINYGANLGDDITYSGIGGPPAAGLAEPGTDFHAVVNRRIAVTPIQLDLTARRLLKRMRAWRWDLPRPELATAAARASAAPEPSPKKSSPRPTTAP